MRRKLEECPICHRHIQRQRRNNQKHWTEFFPCRHTWSSARDFVLLAVEQAGNTVDASGAVPVIRGGVYDGQALYVPYFWEKVEQDNLESRQVDDTSRTVFVHLIGETDPIRVLFPELGKKTAVRLWLWNDADKLHVEEL
jgi:hypothetical protein